MPDENIKLTTMRRFLQNAAIEIRADKDANTLRFPASSEEPVERFYGDEVLSHKAGAVRLNRAKGGAMPLLFNHDIDDPIGVIGGASIEDGRLMVDAKMFSTARAQEILAMIDGGLRNVSIAYRSHVIEEDTKRNVFTVTDWEPYEVSIVTVPADPTVGIGRDAKEYTARMIRADHQPARPAEQQEGEMPNAKTAAAGDDAEKDTNTNENERAAITGGEANGGGKKSPNALEMEQSRIRAINTLCKANKIDEPVRDAWVTRGASLEQVSDDILKIIEERGKSNPQPASRIGLTRQETQTFSLTRAIAATAGKDWSKAPFELECSQEISKRLNRTPDPNKFFVPFEVLERPVEQKRDLTVGTAGAGGYLVGTENQGFIEMLRNRSVAFRMGARRLSGLQGSVTVPRQSAAATAYWLSTEATQVTESQQTFVQMALNPKTVGAYTEISRQLLLQSSPAAEGIVSDDLAQQVALAVDLSALEGSGASGQPTGISNTSGIGSVTGTSLAAAGVLEFMSDVATANVTPMRPGYVTTPAVAALLMVRPELPSTGTTRLWTGNLWDGAMFGIPAISSNQPTAATMVFGDWQELVIAEWGVLEVEVNPYANFQAGIVGVRAMYSMDIGVRRPFAFSRATSIT